MNLRIRTSHRRPRVAPALLDEDNFPLDSEALDEDDDERQPRPLTIVNVPRVRALFNGEK